MSLRAGGRSEATKPPKYLQLLPGLVRFRLGGQRSRKTAQVPSALAWTCAVPSRGTRKSQNRLSTRSTYFDLSGFVSGNSEAAKPLMHPQRLPRLTWFYLGGLQYYGVTGLRAGQKQRTYR